jgi:hypothetical protein
MRWRSLCCGGFELVVPDLRERFLYRPGVANWAREPQPVLTTDNGGFTVGQARLAPAIAPSLIRNSAVAGGLSAT